jgi:hypothetical protein
MTPSRTTQAAGARWLAERLWFERWLDELRSARHGQAADDRPGDGT